MHGTVEIVFRQGYIFLTRNWEKYKVYVYNQLVKEKIQLPEGIPQNIQYSQFL